MNPNNSVIKRLWFTCNFRSKAKRTASFPDANIVMPRVPEKKQLYNEIMNPHFIPPKTAEPPFGDVLESRSVTPPGTVTPIDD